MKISAPHAPLTGGYRKSKDREEFTAAVLGLAVGQAITFSVEKGENIRLFQSTISSRAYAVGNKMEPRRRFGTTKLSETEMQLERVS